MSHCEAGFASSFERAIQTLPGLRMVKFSRSPVIARKARTVSGSFGERLTSRMQAADSLLCVGLDPVQSQMPGHFDRSPESVVWFCHELIEATHPYAAAYKPNLGFFAALGRTGLAVLWAVRHAIPHDIPVILDCKVNDMGATAEAYAHGWFEEFGFDAITVNPYLGEDAVAPYLSYEGKGVIMLCKTSNPGSGDLQDLALANGDPLFLTVADRCQRWETRYPASVGLVVGATYPEQLAQVRERCPDQLVLLPGIGAQGGDLEASIRAGQGPSGTDLLLSASRAIMYASKNRDFDVAAGGAARSIRDQINNARAAIAKA